MRGPGSRGLGRSRRRIVTELATAGCITRERIGQRNRYTIVSPLSLPDPIARDNVEKLRELLAGTQTDEKRDDHVAKTTA